MEEKKFHLSQWLDTATAGIRFKGDQRSVRAELEGHLEDKIFDLLRCFPNMTREEAEERALGTMGDAQEIGRELARIHRPWWGWLQEAASWVMICLMVPAILLGVSECLHILSWQSDHSASYLECYAHGEYHPDNTPEHKEDMTLITHLDADKQITLGDYLLWAEDVGVWHYDHRQEGGLPPMYMAYLELHSLGPLWRPLSRGVPNSIRAVDDLGTQYITAGEYRESRDSYLTPRLYIYNTTDRFTSNQYYYMEVHNLTQGARWLRLEYDRDGTSWTLTIPLTEVA